MHTPRSWASIVLISAALRFAIAVWDFDVWRQRQASRGGTALRRVWREFRYRFGLARPPSFVRRGRPSWNRTAEHVEEQVVRLHVEQPHLGMGQLALLARRVLGFHAVRETLRQIVLRRRDLVVELEQAKRRRPRRITVTGPKQLWGVDFTLVWLLGFVPVWLIGVVDYHGSRLLALERVSWPTTSEAVRVISGLVERVGAPDRLLTDRAPCFRAGAAEAYFLAKGIRHILIKPGHCWTNGRIERIFRTVKQTLFRELGLWLFSSFKQIDRHCADFELFYNRDRPHSAWGGRTPDEVFFGRKPRMRPLGRVSYFDGRLCWYRFG